MFKPLIMKRPGDVADALYGLVFVANPITKKMFYV